MLWIVKNYTLFLDFVKFLINLLMPLIVGIAIAFVLNVPMKQIEKKIFKIDKRKHKKLIRILSLLISIILIFGVVGLILFLVIPEVIQAVVSIGKNIPDNIKWINSLIDKLTKIYPSAKGYIKDLDVKSIVNTTIGTTGTIVSIIVAFLSSAVSKLITFFFGFIVSIYILLDKESLAKSMKKIITAFASEKITDKIINVVKLSNVTFTSFLTGQFLDACLTGFEFFLILWLINIPYALILGVLFAITALIPYIGAFITLVVGIILVGVVNPINIIWYVVVFFLVQQFDDNFTYPRIVGGSVGLPPLWALLAVLIGGSLFGFVGMIISIPIVSILYSLLKDYVNNRLKSKQE